MPPRFVVFDFDGTLADSMPFFLENLDAVARTHGFRSFAPEDLPALRRMSTRELMAHVGLPWWKLPRVSRDFRQRMRASAHRIALFPDVPRMLATLAQQVPVGIVTSNSQANVEAILGDAMAHVAVGEYAAAFLGKTGRLRRICRRAGVAPEASIYIGDEERDIAAARASGMRSGAVSWGYAAAEAIRAAQPDHVFLDRDDLVTQLLRAA
ncbi:HAD hydrolase-like protein [Verticiella alkaliphila]|uniref:HAD hydrolase-like protein n=1 Tax=Verticiella alkaliphila TaxID=2779529 RepID=UPI00211242FE|nr:HAD hydrolase-like protein [Verticiella sp. GG226]